MATITTSFTKIIETSTKVTQNVTGYLRLYLKYGNRNIPEMKDTIYYEIRQQAVNPYGNYLGWEWYTALAWSIKQGNTNLASGSFVQNAIYSDGKEVVRASGSFQVTHDSDGTWAKEITLNGYVYTTSLSAKTNVELPIIIIAPTISISGVGSTSSLRAVLGTSGVGISVVLGNTTSINTNIQYSTDNKVWTTLLTKNANGTYSITIPSSLLSTFPTNNKPTIYLRASNSNGSSSSIVCYLSITLLPNITKVELTPVSGISTLDNNNIFVKTLSKPKITTTATAPTGTTIKQYDLTNLGGYNTNIAINNITNPYTYTNVITKSGNINAIVKVIDKRDNYASKTSNTANVIDYYNPTITNLSVQRCNQDGTLNKNGTYAKLSFKYNIAPITSGNTSYNTRKLEFSIGGTSYTQISISAYNGTINRIIGGSLAITNSYKIYVRLTDITNKPTNPFIVLPSSEVTISKRAGGKGVTFGRIAEEDGFNVYMDADFKNDLKYKGKEVATLDDTGWIEASITEDFTNYQGYDTYAPKYRRFMKIIEVRGMVSPTKLIEAGQQTIIFKLPVGFRPSMQLNFVQQGSSTNKWNLRIETNGDVKVTRYGITSEVQIATNVWLPFNSTFLID